MRYTYTYIIPPSQSFCFRDTPILELYSDVGLATMKKQAEDNDKKSRIVRSVAADINQLNSVMTALSLAAPATAFAAAKGVSDYVSASIANMSVK